MSIVLVALLAAVTGEPVDCEQVCELYGGAYGVGGICACEYESPPWERTPAVHGGSLGCGAGFCWHFGPEDREYDRDCP